MMKLQKTYVMLVALILVFAGCDKLIYDQQEPGGVDHTVHLSVNVRAAQAKSGLRAAEGPSINTDGTDHEDKVYDLAMLVFNSDGGQRVGIVHLNNSLGSGESTHAFKVELTANKNYDFYFVANMPNMRVDLTEANIPNREAMDNYLRVATRELSSTLYQGASAMEGFPMARIYKNQLVEAGGTIYQPKPFYPKQGSSEEYSVVATSAGTGDVTRDYVELIRVVAKLEVNLDGTTDLGVDKIYFRNANHHFRLVEFDTPPAAYFNNNSTNTELRRLESSNTYIYYMPEAMISSATWNPAGSSNQQPINYFTIVTLDGTEYDIPIISNETSITSGYLEKAKGTFPGYTPDYTIHRNHHYKYMVRNLEQIEVIYEVEPWNLVERHTYLGYGYNVHIDENGKVTVNNTVDACPPHEIKLVAINGATFEGGTTDTERVFTDDTPGKMSPEYPLSNIPSSGEYLQVWYNDILVKTFSN
ncbi:fimbrial protein [Proteiniphilum sp.]|uniref:fimbrial protein n=1 Tax=Proteiniphilum sp. TaxID=1926877 RepID=UPI00332FB43C